MFVWYSISRDRFFSVLCFVDYQNQFSISFLFSSQFDIGTQHWAMLWCFFMLVILRYEILFSFSFFFLFFISFSIKLSKRFPYESHDWESVDEICNIKKIEYLFVYRYVRRDGCGEGRKIYLTWGRNKKLMIFLLSWSVHAYYMRIQKKFS